MPQMAVEEKETETGMGETCAMSAAIEATGRKNAQTVIVVIGRGLTTGGNMNLTGQPSRGPGQAPQRKRSKVDGSRSSWDGGSEGNTVLI